MTRQRSYSGERSVDRRRPSRSSPSSRHVAARSSAAVAAVTTSSNISRRGSRSCLAGEARWCGCARVHRNHVGSGPAVPPSGTAVQCTRSFRFRDPECARSRAPFHRGRTGIAGFVVKIEYAQLVGQQAIRDCSDLVKTREQSLTPAANESFTTSKRPEPTRRLRRLRRSASRRIRRSDPPVINRGAAPLPRRVADLHRCWAAP